MRSCSWFVTAICVLMNWLAVLLPRNQSLSLLSLLSSLNPSSKLNIVSNVVASQSNFSRTCELTLCSNVWCCPVEEVATVPQVCVPSPHQRRPALHHHSDRGPRLWPTLHYDHPSTEASVVIVGRLSVREEMKFGPRSRREGCIGYSGCDTVAMLVVAHM